MNFFVSVLSAKALHLLMMGDTKDVLLGPHVLYNMHNMEQSFFRIAKASKCRFYKTSLATADNTLTGRKITQWIEQQTFSKNDIVVIYYSGHGVRQQTSPTIWPSASLYNEETEEKYVELSEVAKKVILKKGALCIALFDCCNVLQPPIQAKTDSILPEEQYNMNDIDEGCKKLFIKPYGLIIASSASPRELSYSGVFPRYFLVYLFQELKSSDPQWSRVFEKTKQACLAETEKCLIRESDRVAHDYYKIPHVLQTTQYKIFLHKHRKHPQVYIDNLFKECVIDPQLHHGVLP